MIKYLIASHGCFASGTESFLSIMIGKNEKVFVLEAFLDEISIEDKVKQVFEEIGEFSQLIVFCDIHGGSVAQEIYRQSITLEKNIQIIAGYNIALVLEIITRDSEMNEQEIREAINNSKEAIVYVNDFSASEENDLF